MYVFASMHYKGIVALLKLAEMSLIMRIHLEALFNDFLDDREQMQWTYPIQCTTKGL